MKKHIFVFLSLLISVSIASAQKFDSARSIVKKDLEDSLAELSTVRESIAKEKIPLLQEVSKLENEVQELSREQKKLLQKRDNKDLGLNQLRTLVKSLKDQNEYTASLLDEFVRTFETRINFSETQLYAEVAEEARLGLEDVNIDEATRFGKQLDVLGAALDRLEKVVGGYTFKGKALTPNEDIEEGTFGVFGPSVYFSSKSSDLAGISFSKLNAAEAAIAVPGEGYAEGIRGLLENGDGTIPADATLGKALKIEQGKDSIAEHLAKGGSVGYVIISLGIACLILGLIKIIGITSFKTPSLNQVQSVLSHVERGRIKKAESESAQIRGTGGELLETGIANIHERRGTLEELLFEKILGVRPKLEKFLPFIAITAAAAPLLGLLGTVTGMIKTFNLITIFGTGDAKSLSSGISEALVTTELGLVVAIPSLILHGMLSRMAKEKISSLEQIAVSFVNGTSSVRNKNQEDTVQKPSSPSKIEDPFEDLDPFSDEDSDEGSDRDPS